MDKFVTVKRKSDILTDTGEPSSNKKVKTDDDASDIPLPIDKSNLKWKEIRAENLVCDYCQFYSKTGADKLFNECERMLTYNEGDLSKVKVFGKWHEIPRRQVEEDPTRTNIGIFASMGRTTDAPQVAHGDPGLSYTFSNTTVPARSWTPLLQAVRQHITDLTGYEFNFVLINKYRDGNDRMGEHRDDEKDLVSGHPIASLSLGQARDFVFKHAQSRGKNATRTIEPVKMELQHGSLLLMKNPTNTYWYHSLPQRKQLLGARINMTFRKMVVK